MFREAVDFSNYKLVSYSNVALGNKMDTCEVKIEGHEARISAIGKKLGEVRPDSSEGDPKSPAPFKPFDNTRYLKRQHKNWRRLVGEVNGSWLYASWALWDEAHYSPMLFVKFHLSQFPNWNAFLQWSERVFGEDGADLILQAPLRRIDLCVDLHLPFQTVFQTMSQNYVRRVMRFDAKEKTLYFGTSPRQSYAYEKCLPASMFDDISVLNNSRYSPDERLQGVRIEVRHHRKMKPIASLCRIQDLRNVRCPFAHLKFEQVDEAVIDIVSESTRRNIESYQYRAERYGMQQARREFNRSGHFQRDVGRYLRPLKVDLETAWELRKQRFFGGED